MPGLTKRRQLTRVLCPELDAVLEGFITCLSEYPTSACWNRITIVAIG